MKKIDVIETGKLSSKNLKNLFRCGECLHFKHKAQREKEDVCSKIGIKSVGIAPACFTPNVTEITSDEGEMMQLAGLWNNFTHKQRRILTAVLMTKPKGRKLAIGTKVFFKAVGKDYLSNYLAGYVIGYASSGELMVTGSPDKNSRGNGYIATFEDDESVMTSKEFKPKKLELLESKRIVDPSGPLVKFKKTATVDYEPPTLDTAPSHWQDKTKAASKKRKKKEIKEIVIQ